jgi:type I restriction enzyme S subunit
VTRDGVASAKEPVGQFPERYKPVDSGTVFYDPMRILLGSIGMVDTGETAGITSPDHVVVKGIEGKLHYRWFYWWLRSWRGAEFVKSLTRGAVRERMLFRRPSLGSMRLPPWQAQVEAAGTMLGITEAKRLVAEQGVSIAALPAAFLRSAFSGGSPDN